MKLLMCIPRQRRPGKPHLAFKEGQWWVSSPSEDVSYPITWWSAAISFTRRNQ